MLGARCWLPESAITDGILTKHFGNIVKDWAKTYLIQDMKIEAELVLRSKVLMLDQAASRTWATPDQAAQISMFDIAQNQLAESVIGFELPMGWRSNADQLFVERVAEKLLFRLAEGLVADLFSDHPELNELTGYNDPSCRDDYVLRLSLSPDVPILELTANLSVFAAKRLSLLKPMSQRPASEVQARSDAIKAQSVKLGASLGCSTLTLVEFKALSVGDSIVFDVSTQAELNAIVDHHPIAGMKLRIQPRECEMCMQVALLNA